LTPAGTGWVIRLPISVLPTLQDYITSGIIPDDATAKKIRSFIVNHKNILIGGSMGSGKTTLENTLLAESVKLDKDKSRWAIIEDCDEVRCTASDHVKIMVNEDVTIDGVPMDWAFAVKRALRLSLSRLIIGEVRSHASVILDAWRVVMPGNLATIHGNDRHEVMDRFEFLLRREGYPIDRREIAKTIGAIICMRRTGVGRVVSDVAEIRGATADGVGYIFA
jgi:Flp pilus assembly CpaF family ATPase